MAKLPTGGQVSRPNCRRASRALIPSCRISESCVPAAAMRPASMTMTRSAAGVLSVPRGRRDRRHARISYVFGARPSAGCGG